MRECRVIVECPGFRTKVVTITTTLSKREAASPEELGSLYRERWHGELDIRNIKQTLGMDHIRAKSPTMVRKEIWAHLAAYNVIRQLMLAAAIRAQVRPRHLSFKATTQTLAAYRNLWLFGGVLCITKAFDAMLEAIGRNRVGSRPNRVEPREVKRRPKPYEKLRVTRQVARDLLLRRR